MSGRIGICAKCGQRYGDIPDSVTALQVKCQACGDGVVDIPPLSPPTPAPTAEAPASSAAKGKKKDKKAADKEAKAEKPVAKPLAKPIGKPRESAPRPTSAKAVDRDRATPKEPAAPVKPVRPVAKPVKPVKPVRPVAKPVKPVKPVRPVAKPVKPVPPVAKPAPPKPAAEKPAAPKPVASPEAPKPAANPAAPKRAEAKSSAADIIAKAKAKRATEERTTAPKSVAPAAPAEKSKPSAADIIAKAKAKRSAQPAAAAPTAKPAKSATPKPAAPQRRAAPAAGSRRPKVAATGGGRAARIKEDLHQPKSKAPMITAGVVILLLCGLSAWAVFFKKDPTQDDTLAQAPDTNTSAGTSPAASGGNSGSSAPEPVTPDPPAGDNADTDGGGETSTPSEEASGEGTPEPEKPKTTPQGGVTEWSAPEPGGLISSSRGITDPSIILLEEVPQLGKPEGVSDDLWNEVQEDLALFMEDSGAMSNRAGRRLADDSPFEAFPAIVNALLQSDYDTPNGNRLAASLNDLLSDIGKGTNYGWKRVQGEEPGTEAWNKAVVYNKAAVSAWYNKWVSSWSKNPAAWAAFTKTTPVKEESAGGGIVGPGDD